jgi:ribosome maturation factor RimP
MGKTGAIPSRYVIKILSNLIPFGRKFCYNAPRFVDGLRARFSFVGHNFMDVVKLVETTVNGLGYELVDCERSGRGLLRVFIDKPEGISVDDCQVVSNQLTRLFLVENVDYDRLEVSSPGLDRSLKKEVDFVRFAGEKAQLKLRMALAGRKNFVGVIGKVSDGVLQLDVDGNQVAIELSNLDKARLVPTF